MRVLLTILVVTIPATNVLAVPRVLTHQGRLLDSSGQPLAGTIQVTFSMYDAAAAGNEVWSEAQVVTFDNGFFSVTLGQSTPLDENVLAQNAMYLGITIGGSELLPRHRIVSAPYAIMAGSAESLLGPVDLDAASTIDGQPIGATLTETEVDAFVANNGYALAAELNDGNTSTAPVSWNDIVGAPATSGVPAGAVMFFDLAGCPTGWSPLPAANGRVVVGVGTSATRGGTVGAALADLGGRAVTDVAAHVHSVDPPSETYASTSAGYHNHSLNPAAFSSSSSGTHSHAGTVNSGGDHDHNIHTEYSGGYGTYGVMGTTNNNGGNLTASPIANDGSHNHTVYIASANPHSHSIDIPEVNTYSAGSHTHDVTADPAAFESASAGAASVDVTMPYIQLLICRKD